MSRWNIAVLVVLLCLVGASAHQDDVSAAGANLQSSSTLTELIHSFFRADDPEERAALIPVIEDAANGSIEAVAETVTNVQLWSALPSAHGTFAFGPAARDRVEVAYQLPVGYDPATRHSMILCMSDHGMSPVQTFALAREALGDTIDGFVLIGPGRSLGGAFHQPAKGAADLHRLVLEIRRRIHVDTDRVFLFGAGEGGEAAWMAAIAHGDLFAGVITLSSYPYVPYPEQVYPFLLGNLRHVPLLAVWTAPDAPGATTRQALVAAHNRAIVALAERAGLPIVGFEVPRAAPGGLKPPPDQAAVMLRRHRAPPGSCVSRWFRFPGQGDAGWVRQARFAGDVWSAEQLSILTSPLVDRDRFISDVIRDKLAYLGGWIEDQTIKIETKSCARIDVLLPYGSVDMEKPITVRCNGKRRYSRRVRPSIRTLLETAYEGWEFQRLTVARLSFSIKADAAPP